MKLEAYGLRLPEVKPGDDLAAMIVKAAEEQAGGLKPGDVLVVASKVVSKALGLVVRLEDVKPSPEAVRLAKATGGDPRHIQLILKNSDRLLLAIPFNELIRSGIVKIEKMAEDVRRGLEALKYASCELAVDREGQIYSNAGIDFSNSPEGYVTIPPANPDGVAREIRHRIRELTGVDVPVIISDTEYWFFLGSLDFARGCSGLRPISRKLGAPDLYGSPKFGGVDAVAHELACTAALIMGQASEGVPAVLIRGYRYEPSEEGLSEYVLRPEEIARALAMILRFSLKVFGPSWAARLLRTLLSAWG